MINLYQLPQLSGRNYSFSPFCLKLELYLKATNLNYHNNFSFEFNKSPTGKMPYIEIKGKKIADSNLIIQMLNKQYQLDLDYHLTNKQKAISHSFIRLCEDSLYPIILYSRWLDKNNYIWQKEFIKAIKLPKLMANIVYKVSRKNIFRQLNAYGLASLTSNEVYAKAESNLRAISEYLDGQKNFFNDKLSLVDIVVFSFVINAIDGSCGKRLEEFTKELTFNNFIHNMQSFLM
ncbi:MAG: glutathione S-transferase family protein [Francisella sp.]